MTTKQTLAEILERLDKIEGRLKKLDDTVYSLEADVSDAEDSARDAERVADDAKEAVADLKATLGKGPGVAEDMFDLRQEFRYLVDHVDREIRRMGGSGVRAVS